MTGPAADLQWVDVVDAVDAEFVDVAEREQRPAVDVAAVAAEEYLV